MVRKEEISDEERKNLMKGEMIVQFTPRHLSSLTEVFDGLFPELNLQDLPEYQAAINAMEAYREAATSHLDSKYKEGKLKSFLDKE